MKTITSLLTAIMIMCGIYTQAQEKYFTRNGTVTFFSSTPMEDINAENHSVTAVIDAGSGAVEFTMLMKSFNFKKALMQEHFNENYVESDKFPKATFKGNIVDMRVVNFTKDGTYNVVVKGDLTLHGVTQPIETPATIKVAGDKVSATTKFNVKPEDHKIEIPAVVRDKIAAEIEVKVSTELQPLKK